MITIMCLLGWHWNKKYYHLSESEIYKCGLIGIFFAHVFGGGWLH